jgi:hypothetical protein
MIRELAWLLSSFSGPSGQTRCFNHVLSLVARTIIRQFDVHPSHQTEDTELKDLAEGIEMEEFVTEAERNALNEDDEDPEGWIDEQGLMDEIEREAHDESVRPVKLVLVKVNHVVL